MDELNVMQFQFNMMAKDIETRTDLELLMKTFYDRLLNDASINYVFTHVAKIDLEAHLPKIVDFWEQVMFNTGNYKTNVMQVHLALNDKEQLTAAHFSTWLNHFEQAVNERFIGMNAEKIKTRALSIATMMKIKTGNAS